MWHRPIHLSFCVKCGDSMHVPQYTFYLVHVIIYHWQLTFWTVLRKEADSALYNVV